MTVGTALILLSSEGRHLIPSDSTEPDNRLFAPHILGENFRQLDSVRLSREGANVMAIAVEGDMRNGVKRTGH